MKFSTVPFYAGGKVAAQTSGDLKDMYSGLVVESGPMKDWKLLTPSEYGGGRLPDGQRRAAGADREGSLRGRADADATSGDYRATQLAR